MIARVHSTNGISASLLSQTLADTCITSPEHISGNANGCGICWTTVLTIIALALGA